jgi:protein-S-isoprenylcysteine O-methyltransferase Ste14
MAQSLTNRLVHATIIWLAIALVLWAGWGWDDRTGFMAEPARPALLLVWLGLCWYGALANTRTSNACGKNEIRKHRQVFWFVLPILIGWFVYLPYADRHQIATSSSAFLRWLGLAIFGITYGLRIESIRAQGPQFSCAVAIQEQHRLTTGGPYRWMRHPAYTGVIGIIAGASLVFANPLAAVVMTGLVWVWMEMRIRDEEKLLLEEFGLEFSHYARQTRKLIPFVY